MTPVRLRPLWRFAAFAALVAVAFVTPHRAGHEEVRLGGSGERALVAAGVDGGAARPAPCLLCLAGTQLPDARTRVAAAPVPAAGLELPLALRGSERPPRETRREPAAPRAPPVG